jgi:hypothetical protein
VKKPLFKLLLALSLLFAPSLFAQTTQTSVTGTITDSNSVAYYPATVQACLTPVTTDPVVNGQHVNPNQGVNYCGPSVQTSPAGSFTMALWPNSGITPGATQWNFKVTAQGSPQPAGKGPQTFQSVITISGSSQSVSATLSAAAPVLLNSGGSASPLVSPNLSPWYASPNCGTQLNCTTINANGHFVIDATSTSTTTVTCPNSDCNFTGTDVLGRPIASVGQTVWATTQGAAGFAFLNFTTVVCPQTTILSINGANSITLNATCTASGSANVVLVWGTKDGAALATAGVAAQAAGAAMIVPANAVILTDQPFLNSGTYTNNHPTPALISAGGIVESTEFIMTPDFNWAACTGTSAVGGGVCFGSVVNQITGIYIWGTGLPTAQNANCANGAGKVILAGLSQGAELIGVNVNGVCPGTTGEGIELNTFDENFDYGGVQDSMTKACVVNGIADQLRSSDCHNQQIAGGLGLVINSGASAQDLASIYLGSTTIAGNFNTHGSHFVGNGATFAVQCNSGGRWTSDGDFIGIDAATQNAAQINTGCVAGARNTQFNGSVTGLTIGGSATFIDQGGNTISGASVSGGAKGQQIVIGKCTGVATASSTLGLWGAGASATPCTSTTVSQGVVMGAPGTLSGLAVAASAGGVNASSGVVTVLKNGVTTAVTCTIGTSTGCSDISHTAAYVLGDIISIQFTTQAADTLANVYASVFAW